MNAAVDACWSDLKQHAYYCDRVRWRMQWIWACCPPCLVVDYAGLATPTCLMLAKMCIQGEQLRCGKFRLLLLSGCQVQCHEGPEGHFPFQQELPSLETTSRLSSFRPPCCATSPCRCRSLTNDASIIFPSPSSDHGVWRGCTVSYTRIPPSQGDVESTSKIV